MSKLMVQRLPKKSRGRRRSSVRGRRACLLTIAVGAILCLATTALATPIDWNTAVSTYARDPYRNRRALLSLRNEASGDVPAVYILAVADAELRAKRFGAARERFAEAIERGLEGTQASWARLGLAWASLAQGDVSAARTQFGYTAESGGGGAAVGAFGAALLDAADRVPDTEERFEAIVVTPGATDAVRQAARLAVAYARYWDEDFDGARDAFERFATLPDVLELRDDAQYGAAWVRIQQGDRAGARDALMALAKGRLRSRKASHALINLEPQALIRSSIDRYRKGPLRPPDQQIAELLNLDGVAMAQAALRWMGNPELQTADFRPPAPVASWRVTPPRARSMDSARREATLRPASLQVRPGTGSSGAAPTSTAVDSTWWNWLMGFAVTAVAVVVLLQLRARS